MIVFNRDNNYNYEHQYIFFSADFFYEPGNYEALKLIKFHDFLFFFLLFISCFVFIILLYILFNYTLRSGVKQSYDLYKIGKIIHNPTLEFIWTVIPTIILINMAVPTFGLLYNMDLILEPKMNIKILGNQWYWSYESNDFLWNEKKFSFDSYIERAATGERRLLEVDNFLIIPTKMELRLLITARDVLHSFSLPSLGIKIDACPGRLNANPLTSRVPGTFIGQCSELCGPNHGFMPIIVESRVF